MIDMEPTWRAGVAATVITPAEPMWLAGWAVRTGPSRGTLTELFAKALALEDPQGGRLVLLTSDLRGGLQGAYNVCRHRGSQVVPVDPETGLRVEALAEALGRTKVAALVVTPNVHNPPCSRRRFASSTIVIWNRSAPPRVAAYSRASPGSRARPAASCCWCCPR